MSWSNHLNSTFYLDFCSRLNFVFNLVVLEIYWIIQAQWRSWVKTWAAAFSKTLDTCIGVTWEKSTWQSISFHWYWSEMKYRRDNIFIKKLKFPWSLLPEKVVQLCTPLYQFTKLIIINVTSQNLSNISSDILKKFPVNVYQYLLIYGINSKYISK